MTTTHTQELIALKTERLHVLELQQAQSGPLYTPPHIVLEVQQIRTEIERLMRYSRIYMLQRDVLDYERPHPMPGLVALTSPEAVTEGQTSLTQAAFHAIDYHRSALQHCWFVATAGERGSLEAAHWLNAYCEQRNIAAQVWQVQDPSDIAETFGLVQWIYTVAIPESALAPQDVIADITGATKPMSIGMWLACQGKYLVQLQYMTRQDSGSSAPLLLRYLSGDSDQQEES